MEGGNEARVRCRRRAVEKPDDRRRLLLRPRTNRPHRRCAPEERDEFAAPHSMTSSARTMIVGGIARPRVKLSRTYATLIEALNPIVARVSRRSRSRHVHVHAGVRGRNDII
jgi:hypothetical protein